tara:strand:- start:3992 stop:4213 length:222 start_codon:yes stop_codon:yes gene_type:complete
MVSKNKKFWLVRMSDKVYLSLSIPIRSQFESEKVVFDDWEDFKDDDRHKALYKAYKSAKDALDKYKFDKRHES